MLLELSQSPLALEMQLVNRAIVKLLFATTHSKADYSSVMAEWMHPGKPTRKSVEAVLRLPREERRKLCDAITADLDFDASLEDEEFEFRFSSLAAATKDAGKRLLGSIYTTAFCNGGFALPTYPVADRRAWEAAFREANPDVKVCPACLIANLEERIEGRAAVDVDHYLPKSIYPPLAVHGLNMVLLCIVCNRVAKGEKDPLDSGVGITGIWFPYRHAGVRHLLVAFSPAASNPHRLVRIEGTPGAEGKAVSFDRLFNLSARWSDRLDGIHSRMASLVGAVVGRPPDRDEVVRVLRELADGMKGEIAADPAGYIAGCYCDWLATEPKALSALLDDLSSAS